MISDDFEGEFYDSSLDLFETYEQYLDSHITEDDLFYLEDIELARQLREQGYNAKSEVLTREQFHQKKKAVEEARKNQNKDKNKTLAHLEVSNPEKMRSCQFLTSIAEREDEILNGRLLTIIFIRIENKQGEISGFIDLAHRLKTEDFKPYFEGRKKMLPKPTDLSYYNWRTNICIANDSSNFKVNANNGKQGLVFRNKRDNKVINVDPSKKPEENMKRTEIHSADYTQIVLYDHYLRRK